MSLLKTLVMVFVTLVFISCENKPIEEITIGGSFSLSNNATHLGRSSFNAMTLAVDEYNKTRQNNEPYVNFIGKDDKWEVESLVDNYYSLIKEHNAKVVFMNNSTGLQKLHKEFVKDDIIAVNSLNNHKSLSELESNIFQVAKSTEEAHQLLGVRINELGFQNVVIIYCNNEFMAYGAQSIKEVLDTKNVACKIIRTGPKQQDYTKELKSIERDKVDAIVFLSFRRIGLAMKQAREMGMNMPFFGTTSTPLDELYDLSNGAVVGTEYIDFSPMDGNYSMAYAFLDAYGQRFKDNSKSVYLAMQSYDAINIVLSKLRNVNKEGIGKENITSWLKAELLRINNYQGVCGTISFSKEGASKGVYFSLYKIEAKGKVTPVKR
ncbi:ABC transporter substrate-binding protein [Flavobacteriaceae bacterium]|nr:ABC transporter substrate-binding protein [Flavobacteriaceae bacterium]